MLSAEPPPDSTLLLDSESMVEVAPSELEHLDGKIILAGELAADPNWAPPTIDPLTQIRNQRNALLRDSAWTQMPDAPLTAACIEIFRLWRVQLNRWLVDFPDGQTALPDVPALAYLPMADQL